MSRHKVSRGNTSDLIGLWNNRASQIEAPKSTNLLSVNPGSLGVGQKYRKTSAFVPSTLKVEEKNLKNEVKFRKTSAMVLMPTSAGDKTSIHRKSLNVDDKLEEFKPLKNVSGLENGSAELPKLRSALKLSTHVKPSLLTPNNQQLTVNNQQLPKIETSELDDNNNGRRGSVGLGRSKSVCHRVKFVPPGVPNEGKPEFRF